MRKFSSYLFIAVLMGLMFFPSCEKERSCEGCQENKAPLAIAGPDQVITLPTDSILLDGSASNDSDGTISDPIVIRWLWTRVYAEIHTRNACKGISTQGQKIAQNILDKVKFLRD